MTWESAVIIGLCSLNLGSIIALALVLRAAKLWRIQAWLNREMGPITINSPASHRPFALGDETPMRQAGKPDPKDNGSVILMTQERDARLLDGQDE